MSWKLATRAGDRISSVCTYHTWTSPCGRQTRSGERSSPDGRASVVGGRGSWLTCGVVRTSLEADNHRMRQRKRENVRVREAGRAHPRHAIRARVLAAARRLEQHV